MNEKCKNCANPSKACISYLMTLSTKEMLQWCLMWKKRLGWSNADLAEKSGVPKGTIDRHMTTAKSTDDSKGANMTTIRPLICAITGCTMEELESCDGISSAALLERAEAAEKENERLRSVLDNFSTDHKADIAAAHTDDQKKIDFLKQQVKFKEDQMKAKDKLLEERYEFMKRKDRIIRNLVIALSVAVVIIIGALVVDKLNSDIGFLWVDRMSTWFEGTAETTNHFASKL